MANKFLKWLSSKMGAAIATCATTLFAIVVQKTIDANLNRLINLAPDAGTNALVCFALASAIAVTTISRWKDLPKHSTRIFAVSIGAMFFATFVFHGIQTVGPAVHEGAKAMLNPEKNPIADATGTTLILLAWFRLAQYDNESETQHYRNDIATMSILFVLLVAAAALKWLADRNLDNREIAAASLAVAVCNGAIFLGFYATMRNRWPPHLLVHLGIIALGYAQFVEHARDCLDPRYQLTCAHASIERSIALVIAWTLVLGKAIFGAYVVYILSSGAPQPPRVSPAPWWAPWLGRLT